MIKKILNFIFIITFITMGITSCKSISSSGKKDSDVNYRVLGENYYPSQSFAQGIYIARSFEDALAISEGNDEMVNVFSEIDFKKEAVLFVFAGRYKTGGYNIVIDFIKHAGKGKILAQFSVSSPSLNSVVTQAITNPSMIVAIEIRKNEIIKAYLKK